MAKKQLAYTIWVEKYRPDTIKNVLLPHKSKNLFTNLIKDKDIPHLLFVSSSPGVGKTTVAKAIVNEIGADYIYINTSSESGIDTLRSTISKFATSYSLFGDSENTKKICILDEFDGSSANLQAALRAFMEEFQNSCRFILTCNHITKIKKPIQSRCQIVDFNMMDINSQNELKPQIVKRLISILKAENVSYDEDVIVKLVDTFYPDIRKMIGLLQQYSKSMGLIDSGIFSYEHIDVELVNLILNKKFTKARELVIQQNYDMDEIYSFLYHELVPKMDKIKQAQAIIILAQYQSMSTNVIDKEICLAACLLELIGALNG